MATELFRETIQNLKQDYESLNFHNTSFQDYINLYIKWIEVGGDQHGNDLEEDEDYNSDNDISEKFEEDIFKPLS